MNLGQQAQHLTNVGSLVAAQHQHQQPHQPMPPTQQTSATTRHHQTANGLPPTTNNNHTLQTHVNQSQLNAMNINVGCVPLRQPSVNSNGGAMMIPVQKVPDILYNTLYNVHTTYYYVLYSQIRTSNVKSSQICIQLKLYNCR